MTSPGKLIRRTAITTAVAGAATALVVGVAPAANAEVWVLNYHADVTSTIKKLNQTVTFPRGSASTSLDLASRQITAGTVTLPAASTTMAIAGLPLVKVTQKVEQVGNITGALDSTNKITVTQKFNIRITRVEALGIPINLVPSTCITSTPVTAVLTGQLGGFYDPYTLQGTYTIPNFKDCGLNTLLLNLAIPGSGNTLKTTLSLKPAW